VLAIVLGWRCKYGLRDVFSGLALNIERPFRAGEWITIPDGIERSGDGNQLAGELASRLHPIIWLLFQQRDLKGHYNEPSAPERTTYLYRHA